MGLSSLPQRRHASMTRQQQRRTPPCLRCARTRATGACFLPTVNRTIRARWQDALAPCSSCTGEASRMWSAVCSRTSTAGRHPGAKMTRGGAILTSRARIRARSASAPQGRQEPGRRPACDAMDIDGDSEGDREEQPTGQTLDGRVGHRHEGNHRRAGQRAGSRAPRRRDACARPPGCRSGWRSGACAVPPLRRAPRGPLPRCWPRWRCTMVRLWPPYAGLVMGLCITRSAFG